MAHAQWTGRLRTFVGLTPIAVVEAKRQTLMSACVATGQVHTRDFTPSPETALHGRGLGSAYRIPFAISRTGVIIAAVAHEERHLVL